MTTRVIKTSFLKPAQNYLGRYLDRTARRYIAAANRYVEGRVFPADDLSWSPVTRTSGRFVRRTIDVAFGFAGMLALFPAAGLLVPAIKAASPGPAFFYHEREGLNGCRLPIPKFRTMKQGGAASGTFLQDKDNSQAWDEIYGDKVTIMGKYLRILGIDELPQCWLILNGKMTFMGARAKQKEALDNVDSRYNWREVRKRFVPSLCPAAMAMRGAFPAPEESVLLEMYYFGNWSLWLDIKLISRGLLTIAAGRHF